MAHDQATTDEDLRERFDEIEMKLDDLLDLVVELLDGIEA